MASVKRFEDLIVWQKARELCKLIFPLTDRGKFARDFKLRDQINDSSGSIMDNIAEGFERSGNNEFIHFLTIAKGSAGEARSQSYRAFDRGYITETEFNNIVNLAIEIGEKLGSFISYLQNLGMKGSKFRRKLDTEL